MTNFSIKRVRRQTIRSPASYQYFITLGFLTYNYIKSFNVTDSIDKYVRNSCTDTGDLVITIFDNLNKCIFMVEVLDTDTECSYLGCVVNIVESLYLQIKEYPDRCFIKFDRR